MAFRTDPHSLPSGKDLIVFNEDKTVPSAITFIRMDMPPWDRGEWEKGEWERPVNSRAINANFDYTSSLGWFQEGMCVHILEENIPSVSANLMIDFRTLMLLNK